MSSTANGIPDEAWADAARAAREAVNILTGKELPLCMPDEPLPCGGGWAMHAVALYVTLNVIADHQLDDHLDPPEPMRCEIYEAQLANLLSGCHTDHTAEQAFDRLYHHGSFEAWLENRYPDPVGRACIEAGEEELREAWHAGRGSVYHLRART